MKAIYQWVLKAMMKNNTGVVQTLPKRDLMELNARMTAERLMRNGIDPNELKNANQVENAINSIENRPLPVQEGIRSTKSAKVFDIDGNLIDPSKGIIGGKQMKPIKQGETITSENFGSSQFAPDNQYGFGRDRKIDKKSLEKELMKTDNPFSDLVNTPRPKTIKEREAEVIARFEKENKAAAQRIKNRKMVEEAIDNASPGFAGDRKYDAQLVADDLAEKRFGKDFYDLDQKQQTELYGEAFDGLSKQKQMQRESLEDFVDDAGGVNPDDPRGIDDFKPDPEDFAQGGRAGFKSGSFLFEGAKKLGKKYKGSTLESLLENPKLLGTELSYEGIMEMLRMGGMMQDGGRAGFKAGLGKRFLELFKPKPKPKFDVERFRKGPIDLDFLENVDKKDLEPFIRSRDTGGIGSYGMYDDFADMPAGLKAAELISRIKTKDGGINYSAAELFLGKKLKGNESVDELIQMVTRKEMRADGGRIGYADGTPDKKSLLDMIDVQASGSKSGKQQISGAPEGITIDSESLNAIAKADIPISQKVDLILEYKYGKGRDRIEDKGQEIFLDEGGYKDQDIGFGYNLGGEGFSGSVMRDLRTGDDEFKIRLLKRFANGGRIGLAKGMTKRAFMKLMGGIGAGIGAAKSGIFTGLGKGATKQAAKEVVKSTTTPPPYFFELANKIKKFGTDTTPTNDRTIAKSMKSKDGKSDYILEEDVTSGDTIIKKVNKEGDNMITDVQMMELRKGEIVRGKDGKAMKTPDEYEEVTETNSRIYKDEYNAADYADGIEETEIKKIIDEASEQAPSIKKAGGGIARMLGE